MGTAYLPPPLHKLGYLFFSKIVPSSNLMFYIRISPKEAMRRIALNRQRKERFETSSELIRVSSKAFSLLNFGSWIVIDGDRSINQVHDEIISRITHFTNPIWSMH
jgi:dTMP kinase